MSSEKDTLQLIIEGIHERKGRGVTIVDLSEIESAATSCFVIAEGTSVTQTAAIADCVEEYVRTHGGGKPYAIDGEENSDWVIMDYGHTFVHIFLPETRHRYNLEELWSDARITRVPDLD